MTGWRRWTLMAGAGALYLGIFLCGMGLPFGAAAPLGLALFVGYTVLMRPVAQWGANPAMLVLTLLVLAALAAALTGLGRGAALLLGPVPGWLGPLLGLAGLALSRASWSARQSQEMDEFLDQAISGIEGMAVDFGGSEDPERPLLSPEDQAILDAALAQVDLLDLPPEAETPPDWAYRMDDLLRPLEPIWQEAQDALYGRGTLAGDEALALLMLRPRVAGAQQGQLLTYDAVLRALRSGAPRVMLGVAHAATEVLELMPDLWRDLPEPDRLRTLAIEAKGPPEVTEALERLARRIEVLQAEDEAP